MKRVFVLAAVGLMCACGSTSSAPGNGGTAPGSGGGVDSGTTSAPPLDSGMMTTTQPTGDAAPPAGSYTLQFGPITVPPATENTQCLTLRLGNAAPIHVGAIHDLLGTSSHHMIVYKVADTVEVTTPFDCQPFTDTLDPSKGSVLIVSQKKDDLLTFPAGVAYTLGANQMVRIEMHYINATAAATTLVSTTTMIPTANYQYEAGFLFIGDPDISLPPMSMTTLGPVFFQAPAEYAGVHFFAITGHEHKLGTGVTISTAMNASDPGTSVYDVPGWLWSEPATVTASPPFSLPAGGGFRFTCEWDNTTASPVTFGESATDEMCFFWAYYYPSQGDEVCFHTTKVSPSGSDICCPGNPLCQYVQ